MSSDREMSKKSSEWNSPVGRLWLADFSDQGGSLLRQRIANALLNHVAENKNYNFFTNSFCLIYYLLPMHKIKSIFVMFSALFVWLVLKLMGGCFLLAIQLLFISHTGAAACCNCYGRIHLEKLDLDLDKLLTAGTDRHSW